MSTARRRLRRTALAALAVGAGALVPTGAEAAPPTLAVSDSRPIRGETVTVRADLPGSGQRTITLQRRSGSRWVTVARKRSDRKVAATFTRRFTSAVTLRAVTRDRASRRLTVRPVAQTARLALPQLASAGEPLRATAVFAPARARRAVSFQQWTGTTWRTVATTRQDANGQAVATVRPAASTRYRVATGAARGAARLTSASVGVRVSATTPAPPAPALRCDLPAGGRVAWGAGDTSHRMAEVGRLDVTTEDGLPITSKTTYSRTTLTLTVDGEEPVTLGARLRVRGNSTAMVAPKYPYKVKLDERTEVHGMPASKDWLLLANFFDRSLLRNETGFELARRLGAAWTPRNQPVELRLNGERKGLYQLGEGIEVEPARAALPEGAVLLEADSYEDTDPSFRTARHLQVFVKSSQDPAVAARAAEQVRRIEDVLYSDHFADPRHGYRACLDVPSFVDAYLVGEITKNIDAAFNNSVWMVLGGDGRLAMGPAWDFDQGMGNRHNCAIADPEGWFVNRDWSAEQPQTPQCHPTQMRGPEGHWYQRLMSDPWFVAQVRARWREVRASVMGMPRYVDDSAATIAAAAERNFAPASAGGAGMPLGSTILEDPANHVFHGSWPAEAAALSTWLERRLAWLDTQLG